MRGVIYSSRRSGSSKRRIKTSDSILLALSLRVGEVVPAREGLRHPLNGFSFELFAVGEVVPAREGLRLLVSCKMLLTNYMSEKWFQQEKD